MNIGTTRGGHHHRGCITYDRQKKYVNHACDRVTTCENCLFLVQFMNILAVNYPSVERGGEERTHVILVYVCVLSPCPGNPYSSMSLLHYTGVYRCT